MLMKSTPLKYKIKSQSLDSKLTCSTRRFSTQPNNESSFSKKVNHSVKSSLKKKSILKTFQQQIIPINISKNGNRLETSFVKNVPKIKTQIKSGKSNKSYGGVISYGWARSTNNIFKIHTQFNMNLGKISSFMIVQFIGQNKNVKEICLQFSIKILKITQRFDNIKINQKAIIQVIKAIHDQNSKFGELSLLSIIISQSKVIAIGVGKLNCLFFTKEKQLFDLQSSIFGKQSQNQKYTFGIPKNQSFRQNILIKQKQNFTQNLDKLNVKIFNNQQLLWIVPHSQPLNKKLQKQIISNCINKQLALNSKQYSFGEVCMQSCIKILNNYSKVNNQSLLMMVILISQYPFQKQVRQVKSLLYHMKTACNQQQKQYQTSNPKLLRYMGNRSSFVKNKPSFFHTQRNEKIFPFKNKS